VQGNRYCTIIFNIKMPESLLAAAGNVHNLQQQCRQNLTLTLALTLMSTKPNLKPNPNPVDVACAIVDVAPAAANTI